MAHCCRANPRMKLRVTFREHKFIAMVPSDFTVSEAVESLNRLVKELFPRERGEIASLSSDGYTLSGRYVVGETLETGAKVDGESSDEVKVHKPSPAVPHTEPAKQSKKRDIGTPQAKVSHSREAEQVSDDSDSASDLKHHTKSTRVNLFRS